MKNEIKTYYNELAEEYDKSRFDNSYGQFIHYQEIEILNRYLGRNTDKINLDAACGTGRFLDYASHGIDISQEMLKVAKLKYPEKELTVAAAEALPFENAFFDNVTAFHLMMHLSKSKFEEILLDVNRVLKSEGYFIFDLPSEKRRNLTNYSASTWHGGHQASVDYIKKIASGNWTLINYHGVSFFPLHRIPKSLRKKIAGFDSFLCNSLFKEYASYLVFILQKKG